MRCDLSLGGCVWRELKLYKYWAAVRASVTEEDAVRGVLKGTDAAAHPHSYNRQNGKINDMVFFCKPSRKIFCKWCMRLWQFLPTFNIYLTLENMHKKDFNRNRKKNIYKQEYCFSLYSSTTLPIRILPSTGNIPSQPLYVWKQPCLHIYVIDDYLKFICNRYVTHEVSWNPGDQWEAT